MEDYKDFFRFAKHFPQNLAKLGELNRDESTKPKKHSDHENNKQNKQQSGNKEHQK